MGKILIQLLLILGKRVSFPIQKQGCPCLRLDTSSHCAGNCPHRRLTECSDVFSVGRIALAILDLLPIATALSLKAAKQAIVDNTIQFIDQFSHRGFSESIYI